MDDYFLPSENFHLSYITAYRFVNSMINAFTGEYLGLAKKVLGKSLLRKNHVIMNGEINHTKNIEVKLKFDGLIETDELVYAQFSYGLENGLWTGAIQGCMFKPQILKAIDIIRNLPKLPKYFFGLRKSAVI